VVHYRAIGCFETSENILLRETYECRFIELSRNFYCVTASPEDLEQHDRWEAELMKLMAMPDEPIAIQTFIDMPMRTASKPVRAIDISARIYILKGMQAGRQIFNDQVVAQLGILLGAPVAQPFIADVDAMLTSDPDEPQFSYFKPGLAHASLFIPACEDDRDIRRYQGQPENRDRFARLSVLYGWVGAADRQFIYKKQYPSHVYSVDHGNFFPQGPEWTIEDLIQAPEAMLDPEITKICNFEEAELQGAITALSNLSEHKILQAIARPPTEWGITIKERVVVVDYLVRRRQELLQSVAGSISKGGRT